MPMLDRERLLHTHDINRALLFYLDRTKSFVSSHHLFVTYVPCHCGFSVSSQRFSKSITATIALCYDLEQVPLPGSLRTHSTWAVASSYAFMNNVSLGDICVTATWASSMTFIRHYAVDVQAQCTTPVARSVLGTAAAAVSV